MSVLARLCVLIVEDDFSIRRLLADALRTSETEAIEAADLHAARMAMSAARIDLLLLDLGLPDGDGVDFIRELRLDRVAGAGAVGTASGSRQDCRTRRRCR